MAGSECSGRANKVMGVKAKGATKQGTVDSTVASRAKKAGHGSGTKPASQAVINRGGKKATK